MQADRKPFRNVSNNGDHVTQPGGMLKHHRIGTLRKDALGGSVKVQQVKNKSVILAHSPVQGRTGSFSIFGRSPMQGKTPDDIRRDARRFRIASPGLRDTDGLHTADTQQEDTSRVLLLCSPKEQKDVPSVITEAVRVRAVSLDVASGGAAEKAKFGPPQVSFIGPHPPEPSPPKLSLPDAASSEFRVARILHVSSSPGPKRIVAPNLLGSIQGLPPRAPTAQEIERDLKKVRAKVKRDAAKERKAQVEALKQTQEAAKRDMAEHALAEAVASLREGIAYEEIVAQGQASVCSALDIFLPRIYFSCFPHTYP